VLYEAPHRILETLEDIERIFGAGRPVVVARELTKLHEEFLRGSASEVRAVLASRATVKGEITLLIGRERTTAVDETSIEDAVDACLRAGMSRMDALKEVARRRGLSKRDVYRATQITKPHEIE
jgi:16S rRNA (cytidine1402-2'-O)-methyltransferase